MGNFNDEEVAELKASSLISSVISIMGCFFIVITIWKLNRIRESQKASLQSLAKEHGGTSNSLRGRTQSDSNLEPDLGRPEHALSGVVSQQGQSRANPNGSVAMRDASNTVDSMPHVEESRTDKSRSGTAVGLDGPRGTTAHHLALPVRDPAVSTASALSNSEVQVEQDDSKQPASRTSPQLVENMQQTLLWLSVSDIIMAFCFFLNYDNDDYGVCILQAVLLQFGGFACFAWTFTMALELYYILIESNEGAATRLRWYHIFVWGLSAISTIGLGAGDMLGPPGPPPFAWCWVKANIYARFFPFYIPFGIVALSIVILYAMMIHKVRRVYQGAGWGIDKRLFLRLGLYPAIFVVTWIWGLAHRIEDASNPNGAAYFIAVMHAVFTPLQGLLDAMLYGLTNTVIRDGCRHLICNMPCIYSRKGNTKRPQDNDPVPSQMSNATVHSSGDRSVRESTASRSNSTAAVATQPTQPVMPGGSGLSGMEDNGASEIALSERMSLGPHTPPAT